MSIKDRTRKELEERIEDLEWLIAHKGVGSKYLQRAERIQRDLNIALMLGAATTLLGITAWMLLKNKRE